MRSSIICPNLLPVEIWLACWTLCSRQQLRRLTFVCRLFRSLVLPLLLQHQTLDAAAIANGLSRENWIERLHRLHRTAVRLDKLKEEPYASLVRSWTFAKGDAACARVPGVQNIQLFDGVNDRVVATFSTTLGFYRNLSSLHLTRVTVDVSLSKTLNSLSRLNDLHFHNCKILISPGFLPLQSLGLDQCDLQNAQDPLLIAAPESLLTLKPASHISQLISGFGPRRLNHLTDVWLTCLTVQDVDLLFRFFEQCPQLESLTIRATENHTTLPGVRPNCIPHLRSLAAPSIFHQALAPGRPLSHVEVLRNNGVAEDEDYARLTQVCCDIARSSVPLRNLVLPAPWGAAPSLEFLVGAMSLFPDLKRFSFTVQLRIFDGEFILTWFGRQTKNFVEDDRHCDLNDEVAFDYILEDVISDDEADEERTIIDVRAPNMNEAGTTMQPVNLPRVISLRTRPFPAVASDASESCPRDANRPCASILEDDITGLREWNVDCAALVQSSASALLKLIEQYKSSIRGDFKRICYEPQAVDDAVVVEAEAIKPTLEKGKAREVVPKLTLTRPLPALHAPWDQVCSSTLQLVLPPLPRCVAPFCPQLSFVSVSTSPHFSFSIRNFDLTLSVTLRGTLPTVGARPLQRFFDTFSLVLLPTRHTLSNTLHSSRRRARHLVHSISRNSTLHLCKWLTISLHPFPRLLPTFPHHPTGNWRLIVEAGIEAQTAQVCPLIEPLIYERISPPPLWDRMNLIPRFLEIIDARPASFFAAQVTYLHFDAWSNSLTSSLNTTVLRVNPIRGTSLSPTSEISLTYLCSLHRLPCHLEVRQHANLISLMPDCCLTGSTSTRHDGSLHVFFFSIHFLSSLVPPICAHVVLNMRIQYFFFHFFAVI
ncbi:hypothetical protein B0H19DRAFT_1368877 [Mycena capillaripes]|nr:hypothetical protein B0H19DRAFT_1368877 [Mycena capillaripes]